MFTSTAKSGGGGSTKKKKKTTKRKITPKSVEAKMKGEKPTEPTLAIRTVKKKKK